MAILGSTVDPRLGAVSPAAIQALSQAGAATGQMYANLGGSIAGVIQDFKSKKDDSALQEALAAHGSFDEKTGKLTVDRKAFLAAAKDNKVSSKLANAYLKNELEISSMQNEMDIQNKMAGYKGREVQIAEDAETRLNKLSENQIELGEKELNLKAYEVLSNDYNRFAQLKLQRDQLAQNKEFKELDLGLVYKELDQKIIEADRAYVQKTADFAKDNGLTQAQIKLLDAESLFKKAQAESAQADLRAFEDGEGLLPDEVALTNSVSEFLGMDSTAFQALDVNARRSLIDERLEQVRLGDGNLDDPSLQILKKLSDRYLNQGLARMTPEEFAAYQQQRQPVQVPRRRRGRGM